MEWQTDWGLRGRMAFTMFLLFALYIVFLGALTLYFRDSLLPIVVVMVSGSGPSSRIEPART